MSKLQDHTRDFKDAAISTGVTVIVGTRLMAGAATRIGLQLTANGMGALSVGAQKAQSKLAAWETKMEDPAMTAHTRDLAVGLKRKFTGMFRKPEVTTCAT